MCYDLLVKQMEDQMTLDQLKTLINSGEFHHATYRTDFARGLHIYKSDPKGFRGFDYVGCFSEICDTKETINAAYEMTRKTGISVNSYGNG